MIKHFLEFVTSGHGEIEILEPIGFDGIEFGIEKDSKRIGIDSSYAGARNKIRIAAHSHFNVFDIIMYNLEKYGYEAVIKYKIQLSGSVSEVGQLNLVESETDELTYIEFSIKDIGDVTVLKNRDDTIVNLFSNEDLDDNPITPCETKNVLLKAKPITGISKWETPVPFSAIGAIYNSGIDVESNTGVNAAFGLMQYDLQDTLSYAYRQTALSGGIPNLSTFTYIKASENIKNVKIDFTNVDVKVSSNLLNNPIDPVITDASGYSRLVIRWGDDLATSSVQTLFYQSFGFGDSGYISLPESMSYTIPLLKRNQTVWIYIENKVEVETSGNTSGSTYSISNYFNTMNITIEGTSIAFNTVVPMVRLYDAMKYVVKSASGLNIEAPRWEPAGEFHDQFITTTPLMRNLLDKPFNMAFKDITDNYFPEIYGDYQIKTDNTVYIGRYPDFFPDRRLIEFTGKQYEDYNKTYNPNASINQFIYQYSNYASKKENEQENTYDIVHGEKRMLLSLIEAKNKKEVKVGFIRDPFLIEQQRRKSYDLSDNSATQDDNKVYIVDVIPLSDNDRTYTETSLLQHTYNAPENKLSVINNQSFSWVLLGVTVGSEFSIQTGANSGLYLVDEVDSQKLVLINIGGTVSPVDIAAENTTFTYNISEIAAQYTIRTNEDFLTIENIADGSNFGNLRFTVARNIKNYYEPYLATANAFSKTYIKKTLYNNNPDALTQYSGEDDPITEGGNFYPENKILSPYIAKPVFILKLSDFLILRDKIRDDRGYISYYDSLGLPANGFIQKAICSIKNISKDNLGDYVCELQTVVELKHEPFLLFMIKTQDTGLIVNGTNYSSDFTYAIDDFGKLHIFDATGKRIFVPVPYNRVKVNNSGQAATAQELSQWLNSIQ